MPNVSLSWRSWLSYAAKAKPGGKDARYLYECTEQTTANPSCTRAKLYKLAAREFLTHERLIRLLDLVNTLEGSWRKHGGIGFIDCAGPVWKPLPHGGHQKIDFHDQTS